MTVAPQDLPGIVAAQDERIRRLEALVAGLSPGGFSHNHMGTGTDSTIAAGLSDSAQPTAGDFSTAVGDGAQAPGVASAAVGTGSRALGDGAFAALATATGVGAVGIIGDALGDLSVAISDSTQTGPSAIAIGSHVVATGLAAVAIGALDGAGGGGAEASGDRAVALGTWALARTVHSADAVVIGHKAAIADPGGGTVPPVPTTDAVGSIAIGSGARVITGGTDTSDGALAVGAGAVAGPGSSTTAIGAGAKTTSPHQIQLGTAAERVVMGAPNSPIADADILGGQISFYLDETGNTLTVKARYSIGGAIKTGTVALV
jgi:trimeric autotransporter adhesin